MRAPLVLLFALSPVVAGAALSPCVQDDIIRGATGVVQMTVEKVERSAGYGTAEGPAYCPVTGTIERVFRGSLKVGDTVTFNVACWNTMPGPWVTYDPDALAKAERIEVHLADGQPIDRGPSIHVLKDFTDRIVWQPYCK